MMPAVTTFALPMQTDASNRALAILAADPFCSTIPINSGIVSAMSLPIAARFLYRAVNRPAEPDCRERRMSNAQCM